MISPRRRNTVIRTGRAITSPSLYPSCKTVTAYWWDYQRNFGDLITFELLRRHGVALLRKPPSMAQLFGVGSIVDVIPDSFSGWVWGSGLMMAGSKSLPRAKVIGVRGLLTADSLGLPQDKAIGDPGLLMPDYFPRPKKRYRLGVALHSSHRATVRLERLRDQRGVLFIDAGRYPSRVCREIAQCDAILATSLHGLIVADAYGIPAAWALPDPVLSGGNFKFRDYESLLAPHSDIGNRRVVIEPGTQASGVLRQVAAVDGARLESVKHGLRSSLQSLVALLPGPLTFPFMLPYLQHRTR